jgi:hypothetical protein
MIEISFEILKPIENDPSFWYFIDIDENIIVLKYTHGILTISKINKKSEINEESINNNVVNTLKISDYLESLMDFEDLIENTKHLINWEKVKK